MSDDAASIWQSLKEWASPLVALLLAGAAAQQGLFSKVFRGGVNLGQMQSVQDQHALDIANLRADLHALRDATAQLATKADIDGLERRLTEISDRLFTVLMNWRGSAGPRGQE